MTAGQGPNDTLIVHTIEVRHAVTLQPLTPLAVKLLPDNSLWRIKQKENWIVLSTDRGSLAQLPDTMQLSITAPNTEQRAVLADRGKVTVMLSNAVSAEGAAFTIKHQLDWPPAAMQLLISLVDTDNKPIAKRTVTAVPAGGGSARRLKEDGTESGLYRSQQLVWGAEFARFSLQVDGEEVAQKSMDYSQTTTQLRQVHDLESNS